MDVHPGPAGRRRDRRVRVRRLRRPRLGDDRGPRALAAPGAREPRLHQRPVPVPGGPAVRPGREPDRRVPPRLRASRRLARRRRRPPVPRRRLGVHRLAQRGRARVVDGQPPDHRVRHRTAPEGRNECPRGPRAPVVAGELPRGPGHVVDVRDLPLRERDLPAGGRDRRRLRARRLRPPDRNGHAARRDRRPRAAHGPGAGPGAGAGGRAARRSRGRAVVRRAAPALRRDAHRGQRDDHRADRLPHGAGGRWAPHRQRETDPDPGGEPSRVGPRPRPSRHGGGHARGRAAHEAAQRQRGADQPLPAAPRLPRPVRRARPVRDRRVRLRDARLLLHRLDGEPERRPPLAPSAAGPDPPHRRTGQEPPQRHHVVAGQRGRLGAEPPGDVRRRARAGPGTPGALRG